MFVSQQHLKDSQCIILTQENISPSCKQQSYLPYVTNCEFFTAQKLAGVHCVNINIDKDPDGARVAFNSFLASLFTNWQSSQIDEEDGIITA